MATRSVIAKLNKETKEIKANYCHNDGYLEHVGTILDSYYQNENKVDELLQQGDISSLDQNIGDKVDFGDYESIRKNKQCVFYFRDRGEGKRLRPAILEDDIALLDFAFEKCNAQYVYLYAYGAWYVYDNSNKIGNCSYQFVELEDVLQSVYK